jgi:ribosomal protein S18 acetylase RimI-like enzyme
MNNLTAESFSYIIRPLAPSDEPFLWEMLYQSLYVPPGKEPFPREVVKRPYIARYVGGWGRAHDPGFVAEDEVTGRPVGAVWMRLFAGAEKGFAHLDDETPETGIALLPGYRGRGVGTALLGRLIEAARPSYPALALSVSAHNPAKRLYERLGFEVVEVREDDHPVMRLALGGRGGAA